ncbi:Nn.00g113300.m01.CDS01 [Neocucurbitaria sp. VM-36]
MTSPSNMATPLALSQATQGTLDNSEPYQFDQQGRPTRLVWNNNAQGALNYRNRSKYPPRVNPNTDATIAVVIALQEDYIADMIQAVYNLETANDGPKYEGRILFARGGAGSISVPDVEAACRALFQQILHQCQFGWCGHQNQDRLVRTKDKTVIEDKTSNCQQRVANTINALRDWKSVCREIIYSDDKIASLANAPLTVYRDKQNQQNANETKKKTKKKEHDALVAQENQENSIIEENLPPASPDPGVKVGKAKKGRARKTIVASPNPKATTTMTADGTVNQTRYQTPDTNRAGERNRVHQSTTTFEPSTGVNYGHDRQDGSFAEPLEAPTVFAPMNAPFEGLSDNFNDLATNGQHFNVNPLNPFHMPWHETPIPHHEANASKPQATPYKHSGLVSNSGGLFQHYPSIQSRVAPAHMYSDHRRLPNSGFSQNSHHSALHQSARDYPPPGYVQAAPIGYVAPLAITPRTSSANTSARSAAVLAVLANDPQNNTNMSSRNAHDNRISRDNESRRYRNDNLPPGYAQAVPMGYTPSPVIAPPTSSTTTDRHSQLSARSAISSEQGHSRKGTGNEHLLSPQITAVYKTSNEVVYPTNNEPPVDPALLALFVPRTPVINSRTITMNHASNDAPFHASDNVVYEHHVDSNQEGHISRSPTPTSTPIPQTASRGSKRAHAEDLNDESPSAVLEAKRRKEQVRK